MTADNDNRRQVRILPADAVELHLRTICQMRQDDPQRLSRLLQHADHRLADHLPEEDLFYLIDLGLIEADGRLLPDLRDVLVTCVDEGPDGPRVRLP